MTRRGEEECHVQLLCRVLIWPEQPQLVDLVGFSEIRRHDPVPFFDPTPKHSDVGHHPSVVIEIGVKHQGFERVIDARHGPENKIRSFTLMCRAYFVWDMKPNLTPSYGGILFTTAWRIFSTFVPSLAEIWKKNEITNKEKFLRKGDTEKLKAAYTYSNSP